MLFSHESFAAMPDFDCVVCVRVMITIFFFSAQMNDLGTHEPLYSRGVPRRTVKAFAVQLNRIIGKTGRRPKKAPIFREPWCAVMFVPSSNAV